MRKLVVALIAVAITAIAHGGSASAGPGGGVVEFTFDGTFSTVTEGLDAHVDLQGTGDIWSEKPFLSRLDGSLWIDGLTPKPQEKRRARVKPQGEIGLKGWHDPGFDKCADGEPPVAGEIYTRGQDRWTIISMSANDLHGTGELWWGEESICVDGETKEGGYSGLKSVLVGSQTAGVFRWLEGPEPYIGIP